MLNKSLTALLIICLFNQNLFSQVKVDKINGDVIMGNGKKTIVSKKTIYNYNTKAKVIKLNVSKYIDTAKKIWLNVGQNMIGLTLRQLQIGTTIADVLGPSEINWDILRLILIKGKLYIRADINDFDDKYIARIIDNKLVTSKNYHLYSSDRFFEVYDDYYIPVLQIELQKQNNTIYITGAFNSPTGYKIVSKEGILFSDFKSKLLMTEEEKKHWFNEYITTAKKI